MSGIVRTKTPALTATVKEDILKHVTTISDWMFDANSQSPLNLSSREDSTRGSHDTSSLSFESSNSGCFLKRRGSSQELPHTSPLSRSAQTYTNLDSGQIKTSRIGSTESITTSPCHGKRSRVSRERLDNLPPLSLVILQACKRMYEGSSDHVDQDLKSRVRAHDVSEALKKEKYDFISFIIARRDALTDLVSKGVMSLQLLALVLERIADVCRLPPLRQDIQGLPSDEKSALMVDRWLRRTAEIMLDGTIEVATTMVANKVCRSSKGHRSSGRGRSSARRGVSSKAYTIVPVAQEGLPITARVHYKAEVDMVHFELQDSIDADCSGAPTPGRFTHFGESPKSVESDMPNLIFEQNLEPGATTPKRWNNFQSVKSVEIFPAAKAA